MWLYLVLGSGYAAYGMREEPVAVALIAAMVLFHILFAWVGHRVHEGKIRPDRMSLTGGQIQFYDGNKVMISMNLKTLETISIEKGEISFVGRDENGFPTNVTLHESTYRPHSWVAIQRFATELKAHFAFPPEPGVS